MAASLRLRRAIAISAVVGIIVPIFFEVLFAAVDWGNIRLGQEIDYQLSMLRLYLWPASFGLGALVGEPAWSFQSLLIISILSLLNALTYATAGAFCWIAINAARRTMNSLRSPRNS
ncbi:MAG: hypothetical protein JSR61_12860 [Proteobacteria bacterium]|nr:hypothetical protein [Pseudomonadota bacterium]